MFEFQMPVALPSHVAKLVPTGTPAGAGAQPTGDAAGHGTFIPLLKSPEPHYLYSAGRESKREYF